MKQFFTRGVILLSSADIFFKIKRFQSILGTLAECQMVCIHIRTVRTLVVIYEQTACKG